MAQNTSEIEEMAQYYELMIVDYILDNNTSSVTASDVSSFYTYNDTIGIRHAYFSHKELIDIAFELIGKKDFAELMRDKYGPDALIIRDNAADLLETDPLRYGSLYKKFMILQEGRTRWLHSAIRRINDNYRSLKDASDGTLIEEDSWEPIPIDRSNLEFLQAIDASEKAVTAIAENNGYASSDPDERNGIVATIRGTISALKAGSLPRSVIVSSMVDPFRYIVKKFGDTFIGNLSSSAVKALLSWLGIT